MMETWYLIKAKVLWYSNWLRYSEIQQLFNQDCPQIKLQSYKRNEIFPPQLCNITKLQSEYNKGYK